MEKLKIGQIGLSFHEVSAAVVLSYFKSFGQPYKLYTAPHEEIFEKYRTGELDMVLGAWLPSSHGKYIREAEEETLRFSTLYQPFCIWGVPDYIPVADVHSVADIAKPEIASTFNKVIQGINEGAGISRFSRNILKEYGLDALGFEFKNGSVSDCTNAFEEAYRKNERVIIPLWEPQYLHYTYSIRALKEPKGLLGSVDNSTIIVRKSSVSKLLPKTLNLIRNFALGNHGVTELDYQYQVKRLDLDQIANDYVRQHPQ